jgi:hypothetical protein
MVWQRTLGRWHEKAVGKCRANSNERHRCGYNGAEAESNTDKLVQINLNPTRPHKTCIALKKFCQHYRKPIMVRQDSITADEILMIVAHELQTLAVDLLNPSAEHEKRQHKLKRLVQSPNSFFMDVKCPGA